MPSLKETGFSWWQLFYSRWVALLLILIFAWITISYWQTKEKKVVFQQEVDSLEAELAQAKGRQLELHHLLQYVNSDSFVEKEAKQKLNYRLAGEEVVVVVQDNSSPDLITEVESTVDEVLELSNPRKWWRYFFKLN